MPVVGGSPWRGAAAHAAGPAAGRFASGVPAGCRLPAAARGVAAGTEMKRRIFNVR
jgi:hypothetical protein